MALIPHSFFPRSAFDSNVERALDIFDPFDQMDMQLGNMFHWLDRPAQTIAPQKYRVTVDCAGFNPASIRTELADGDMLIVTGIEGQIAKGANEQDFTERSFRRMFQLPAMLDTDKMTRFMDNRGTLVIDIPYKIEGGLPMGDMVPRVVDLSDGHKGASMDLNLPVHVDPQHVSVTAKDHDIIIQAQDKNETGNSVSKVSFYRRCTMPDNADLKHMKCTADGGILHIMAPLADHALGDAHKRIPILASH